MNAALICAAVLFLLAALGIAVRARAREAPPVPEPPAVLPDNVIPFTPRRRCEDGSVVSRAE